MDGFGNFHRVACHDCNAQSKSHFVTSDNECPNYYQEVRDSWDTRASDKHIEKLEKENAHLKKLASYADSVIGYVASGNLGNCELDRMISEYESIKYKRDK